MAVLRSMRAKTDESDRIEGHIRRMDESDIDTVPQPFRRLPQAPASQGGAAGRAAAGVRACLASRPLARV